MVVDAVGLLIIVGVCLLSVVVLAKAHSHRAPGPVLHSHKKLLWSTWKTVPSTMFAVQ